MDVLSEAKGEREPMMETAKSKNTLLFLVFDFE